MISILDSTLFLYISISEGPDKRKTRQASIRTHTREPQHGETIYKGKPQYITASIVAILPTNAKVVRPPESSTQAA